MVLLLLVAECSLIAINSLTNTNTVSSHLYMELKRITFFLKTRLKIWEQIVHLWCEDLLCGGRCVRVSASGLQCSWKRCDVCTALLTLLCSWENRGREFALFAQGSVGTPGPHDQRRGGRVTRSIILLPLRKWIKCQILTFTNLY